MSNHLDQPTGDSRLGVLTVAALAIVIPLVLLMRAASPAPIVPDPPADMTLIATTSTSTSTTVAPTTTTVAATTTTSTSTTTSSTTTAPAPVRAATITGVDWDYLADCESGEWDAQKRPIRGTARWNDRRNGYEGGVHFAPSTWDGFRPADFPEAAYLASREQQILVAERVLAKQGPGAWPTCSYKVGMR